MYRGISIVETIVMCMEGCTTDCAARKWQQHSSHTSHINAGAEASISVAVVAAMVASCSGKTRHAVRVGSNARTRWLQKLYHAHLLIDDMDSSTVAGQCCTLAWHVCMLTTL